MGRGNKAWENLLALWSRSTYPNFMDNHPLSHGTSVFQIDGNLGATAAMAEMLVQADGERILLLPALPAAWRRGSVEGLRVPGNAGIDVAWRDGRLERCVIRSKSGIAASLCYAGVTLPVALAPGATGVWEASDFSGI